MNRHRPNTNSRRSAAVLLIDDDPDCRHLFRDALSVGRIRCRLYEAVNGREALEFLRRSGRFAGAPRPALIFTDIEMPGASGLEVLKTLKSHPDLRKIPVIILSGVRDRECVNIAAREGAVDYIVKPPDPAAYVNVVARAARYWLAKAAACGLSAPAYDV